MSWKKDVVPRFLQEDNFKYNCGTSIVGLDVANSLDNEARSVHQICESKQCSFLLCQKKKTMFFFPFQKFCDIFVCTRNLRKVIFCTIMVTRIYSSFFCTIVVTGMLGQLI